MAQIDLDARSFLWGDSGWTFSGIREHLESGDDVTVIVREDNQSIYKFFRDYCMGCERLKVSTQYTGASVQIAYGGPGNKYWKQGVNDLDISYPLRRELEPIVEAGDYIVVQPENNLHQKVSDTLRNIQAKIRGYSVGVDGEYVVPGTSPFHSRPFSDVARLIAHSKGVLSVFSSIALHAFLLGHPRIIVLAYSGIGFGAGEQQPGHSLPRSRLLNDGDPGLFYQTVNDCMGDVLVR